MPTKIKLGWKVVRRHRDTWVSGVGDPEAGPPSIMTYVEGEWLSHAEGCGPLCVFDTKKSALDFVSKWSDRALFRCEYIKSRFKQIWIDKSYPWDLADLPKGTRLASKVRLLREVPRCKNY